MSSEARGSVLVVDDMEDIRIVLEALLVGEGYEVILAANGKEALEAIASRPLDVVVLDVMMPDLSGLDVLRTVRETHSVADLPVIMATAMQESEDIVAALAIGANDYVTKPFDVPVVLARLQTQLALKRARDRIRLLVDDLEVRNRFIRQTFGRYLTDEVVASLLESPERLKLGGEKRTVTILMSDLRGFTSLSERLEPEQVVGMLNAYLATMVDVILAHQGTIDEIIGDAILVLFGAPVLRDDDARRAVACAIDMQRAMPGVNARLGARGWPEIEMGIAVNTGEVVVGNIGSERRSKYAVVGSHVNLAARIESFTVGGQVLIADATRRAVGPDCETGAERVVTAKGFSSPITIHELRGLAGDPPLRLEEEPDPLVALDPPLAVRYTVIEGKELGAVEEEGSLVSLGRRGAVLAASSPIAPLTNLRLRLLAAEGGAPLPGDVYAKVVAAPPEHPSGHALRFSSVPPGVAEYFGRRTGNGAGG